MLLNFISVSRYKLYSEISGVKFYLPNTESFLFIVITSELEQERFLCVFFFVLFFLFKQESLILVIEPSQISKYNALHFYQLSIYSTSILLNIY